MRGVPPELQYHDLRYASRAHNQKDWRENPAQMVQSWVTSMDERIGTELCVAFIFCFFFVFSLFLFSLLRILIVWNNLMLIECNLVVLHQVLWGGGALPTLSQVDHPSGLRPHLAQHRLGPLLGRVLAPSRRQVRSFWSFLCNLCSCILGACPWPTVLLVESAGSVDLTKGTVGFCTTLTSTTTKILLVRDL